MPIRKLAFLVSSILLVATGVAFAQMGTGRITGTITDPEGNAVEGAVISVVDQIGKKLEGTSDEDGDWAILGFRSGTYDFNIEAEGFRKKIEQKAVRQMAQNKLDVVLVPLLAAAAGDMESKNALLAEANELLKQERYPETIAKFEELLVAQPSFYQAHEFIGIAYREMGDYDAALAEFNIVLDQDAGHANALISIGDILVSQQKLEEAVGYFEKAVTQTSDAIVPFNVAEIYFNQQNAVKAAEFYKIATEYNPEWPDAHLKLGYAYLNTGDIDSAKAAFQKTVEIAPDTPQAQMAQSALSSLP